MAFFPFFIFLPVSGVSCLAVVKTTVGGGKVSVLATDNSPVKVQGKLVVFPSYQKKMKKKKSKLIFCCRIVVCKVVFLRGDVVLGDNRWLMCSLNLRTWGYLNENYK